MLKRFGRALLVLLFGCFTSLILVQIVGAAGQAGSWNANLKPPQQVPPVTPQAPQPDGSIIHSVQQGDTLFSIALAYKVSVDDIKALNNIPPSGKVVIGQRLLIKPAPSPTVAVNVTIMVITATNTPGGQPATAAANPPATNLPPTAAGTPGEPPTTQSNPPSGSQAATQPSATSAPSVTPTQVLPTLTETPVPPTETPQATVIPINSKALLCVRAFNDANTNHWQDPDEKLLPGVDLALSQGPSTSAASAQKLTTAPDTAACFDNVPAGQFTVAAAAPAGYGLTTSGQLEVEVKTGAQTVVSFGFAQGYQPGTVVATADAALVADTLPKKSAGVVETLLGNTGLIVLALAGIVLVGGLGVALLARRP